MTARARFLNEFPRAVADDAGAIFVGAGVSMGAGYPSWRDLLHDLGEELGVHSGDVYDLAALAQWSIGKTAGRTRVLKVIRDQIGVLKPVPIPLEVVARLPIRNLWTTNYDRLVERAFEGLGRPLDAISSASDLAIRSRPGAARLYKMHGSIDRLEDLVISTDDYELYRSTRGAFIPLLQAHLTSFSMLFIGLSFSDPNIRHVLSSIRESFSTNPPEHFAIVRPPHRDEFSTEEEYSAKTTQHNFWSQDLLRYGLQVVEIDSYDEVPTLLSSVERRVAADRVWVSGSWPHGESDTGALDEISRSIGRALGDAGFSLVSGSGLTITPAVLAGFLDALQRTGTWDLERRLFVRPFAQPIDGTNPNEEQWAALRAEMARASGTVVFVGGGKLVDGKLIVADGVRAERAAADHVGAFLLPVGSTGGAAAAIAYELVGSNVPATGGQARRPTDDELKRLLKTRDASEIAGMVVRIIKRQTNL